jgi:transposase
VVRTNTFVFVHELDELSDSTWAALAPHLAGNVGDVGRGGGDNHLFLNAVFWVARHGCAWRALLPRFGKHDTVRKRTGAGRRKGCGRACLPPCKPPTWIGYCLTRRWYGPTPRRHVLRPLNHVVYRERNRIERLMSRLKQFRRLATRYDKTASSYLGFVHLVCALLWLH